MISQGGIGLAPKPGRSSAIARWVRAKWGRFSSQFCQQPERPWMKTIGVPSPISTKLALAPTTSIVCRC